MAIRLVLFDLWGTLIEDGGHHEGDPRRMLRARMMREALQPYGFDFSEERIDAACETAGAEHSEIHANGLDITAEARTVLYLRHLDERIAAGLDDEGWRSLHTAVLTPALHTRPDLIPAAEETLRSVKAFGLSCGLISNAGLTPGFVLRQILGDYGLLQHLDHTIFSDEVELSKPSAAIFEQALDAFGVAPEEAAFVGDQPVLDVLGPQSVGIWSIQVGPLEADGITPHARIASLDGLLPALREMGLVAV